MDSPKQKIEKMGFASLNFMIKIGNGPDVKIYLVLINGLCRKKLIGTDVLSGH